MTTIPIRVGVVGAGIGEEYVAAFQRLPEAEVAALCARTHDRMDAVARKYGVARRYTDYVEMLANERLDVVVVATPNHLHHPITMAALHAGINVVCDKPLALDVRQAREMVQGARDAGVRHLVPFVWRFLPAAAYVKELVDSGFVGTPYHINAQYLNLGWGDIHGPMRWYYDRAQAGSGALGNLGSHAIDLIHWWVGEFSRVTAHLGTAVRKRWAADGRGPFSVEVDDVCALLGESVGGAQVVLNASLVAQVDRVKVEIGVYGSEGSLVLHNTLNAPDAAVGRVYGMSRGDTSPRALRVPARLTAGASRGPTDRAPLHGCFDQIAAAFADAVIRGHKVHPGFEAGLAVQRVIDAVQRSARNGQWVTP